MWPKYFFKTKYMEKMAIRTQPLVLFQIFWEFMLDSKTIFKCIVGPDNIVRGPPGLSGFRSTPNWPLLTMMHKPIDTWGLLYKYPSGSMIYLTITWKLRYFYNIFWRGVVGSVLIDISPWNISTICSCLKDFAKCPVSLSNSGKTPFKLWGH